MDVKQLLIDTLHGFGYPVRLQGTLNPEEEYPATFFTYWNSSSTDWHPYDNAPTGYEWSFDVNLYSTDPALTNTLLRQVRKALEAKGFIIDGQGFDVPSDRETHTGRGIDVMYVEKEERT